MECERIRLEGHVSPSPQLGIDKLEVVVSLLPGIPITGAQQGGGAGPPSARGWLTPSTCSLQLISCGGGGNFLILLSLC